MSISEQALRQALSAERLQPYLVEADNDVDLAWATYQWNQRLVGALMPLFGDVEVTLRNVVHDRMSDHFGTDQWWTAPKLLLDDNTREMITPVVRKHRKRLQRGSEGAGRVVADVTFGVWVNLLSRGSSTGLQQPVDYEQNIWRKTLRLGFKKDGKFKRDGEPRRPIRRHVHDRATNLQALRNSAAHHRRISEGIRRPGSPRHEPRIALVQLVDESLELLAWMNPELAAVHKENEGLADALAARPT